MKAPRTGSVLDQAAKNPANAGFLTWVARRGRKREITDPFPRRAMNGQLFPFPGRPLGSVYRPSASEASLSYRSFASFAPSENSASAFSGKVRFSAA